MTAPDQAVTPSNPPESREPRIARRPFATALRILILILAGAAWIMSLELTKLAAGGASTIAWLQQSCGGDATSDCATVIRSYYGYFHLGTNLRIPVSFLGLAYFSMVFVWYLFAGVPTYMRRWRHLVIVFLVSISAVFSLNYIHIMAEVIGRWCPGCVVIHALNGGIILLTLLAFPWRRERGIIEQRPGAGLWFATLALCLCLAILQVGAGVLMVAISGSKKMEVMLREVIEDPAYVRWQYDQTEPVTIPPREDALTLGADNAPYEIVVFSDFQCPACRNAHNVIENVLEKHADQMRITYRHLPLDSECNPGSTTRAHPAACQAALAFEAANQVGDADAAQRFQRLLFGRQELLNGADWAAWAQETGLDAEAFNTALSDPARQAAIQTDVELMQTLKFTAPPIVILNGRVVKYWTSAAAWDQLLSSTDPNEG